MSEKKKPNFGFRALVLTFAVVLIPGFLGLNAQNRPEFYLTWWALGSVALAAYASGVRLAAHNGDKDLDGYGKMLGFGAACVGFFAAVAGIFVSML